MSHTDIYNKIRWILMANFSLKEPNNHYKANLTQDLGLDAWDINLLIFFVENTFNIRFNQGIEKDVSNLKELALMVQQKTANKEYNAA
ncbi:MAG: hypothetical protein R6U65_06455 [Perlabentimonas sp.]